MNFVAISPRTTDARRSALYLAFCLVPAAVFAAPIDVERKSVVSLASRPYLAVLGANPLRFEEALPPPDLSSRPAVTAPPVPDEGAPPDVSSDTKLPDVIPAPSNQTEPTVPSEPTVPLEIKTPAPILIDENQPRVKPEDFLPFFVFPKSGVQIVVPVAPAAPAPANTVPPSSATYRQT